MILQTINGAVQLFRLMGCLLFAGVLAVGFLATRGAGSDGSSFGWLKTRGVSSATVAMQPEQVMALVQSDNRFDGRDLEVVASTPDGVTYAPVPIGRSVGGDLPGSMLTVSTVRDERVRLAVHTGSGAAGHVDLTIRPDGSGSALAVGDPVMAETGPEADRDMLEDKLDDALVPALKMMVRRIAEVDEAAKDANAAG